MQTIEYHGWSECVRLANNALEVIASTQFGPRVLKLSFLGGENLFQEHEELLGKIGPDDEWVNYGGHRLWHAPEIHPRTYQPDNKPLKQAVRDGEGILLVQEVEAETKIGKAMRIRLAPGDTPLVKIDHILTNHNPWSVELAPWAISVVASGGRVVFPQEPFEPHGHKNNFLPVRPLVLWSFTDMADSRWTWGAHYVQLRCDENKANPQKVGVFSSQGWGAYISPNNEILFNFIDVNGLSPAHYPDLGCNFETFTKGSFQEIESLGPLQIIEPGESLTHTEYWVIIKTPMSNDDVVLADMLPTILLEARRALQLGHEL